MPQLLQDGTASQSDSDDHTAMDYATSSKLEKRKVALSKRIYDKSLGIPKALNALSQGSAYITVTHLVNGQCAMAMVFNKKDTLSSPHIVVKYSTRFWVLSIKILQNSINLQ